LSSWDVSNVEYAERMFDGATSFDISAICGWNKGWRELFGCRRDGKNHQRSSASIRFGKGFCAVFLLFFCVSIGF